VTRASAKNHARHARRSRAQESADRQKMVSFPAEVHTSLDMAASSDRTNSFQLECAHSCDEDSSFATPLTRSLQSISGIKRLRDSTWDDFNFDYEGICDMPTSHPAAERDRSRPRFIARLDFSPAINDSTSKSAHENMEIAEVQELGSFIFFVSIV
jgi:hypothetical protein